MTKLNLHGLKINVESLKKAVSEMPTTNGPLPDLYLQVSYDRSDGEILTNMHADCNSQTIYHDNNIVTVGYYTRHTTLQTLVDDIASTIDIADRSQKEADQQAKFLGQQEEQWIKQHPND